MTGWVLAVDVGTSFTTAAMFVDGRAELLEIDNSRYLPSLVFVEDDGRLVVWRHAVSRAERAPKRILAAGSAVRLGAAGRP